MRSIILSLLVACTVCVAQNTFADKSASANTYTLTLNDLTHTNGFAIQGLGGVKELYLPILANWSVDKIHLHLIMTRDQGNDNAEISAYIDQFPISSISLSKDNNGQSAWDFDIDPKFIKSKLVTVSLRRNFNANSATCQSYLDPGNWVAVSGDSSISYHYTVSAYQPDLAAFPAPFIQDPSLMPDKVALMMPDQFTTNELEAAYYTANALYKRKTWRGLTIEGHTFSETNTKILSDNNLVIIGTGAEISKIMATDSLPLKIDSQGMIIGTDGKPIDDKTGVIMMVTSPWNNEKAALIVTGNNDVSLSQSAQVLRDPNFKQSVLYNKYILVKESTRKSPVNIDWNNTTVKELGYKNQVVYGSGDNSIKYVIDLPANMTPEGMDFTLDFAVSPLLSSRNSSFISLVANGFPVTGIRIGAGTDQKETWKFHIGQENLLPGKNILNFIFNLKFYNMDCAPNDMTMAWATIYDSSQLSVQLEPNRREITFADFNSFSQDVSVLLPKGSSIFTAQQLINLTLDMAVNLFNINTIQIYYDDTSINDTCKDQNLIYIGNINDNKDLVSVLNHFPFSFFNDRLVIKQKLIPLIHPSDEVPVGIIQLTSIPSMQNKLVLFITGRDIQGYKDAIDTYFNPQKNQYLRGDAALIYKDGTFTSLNTVKLETKLDNDKLVASMHKTVMMGFISFVTTVFGLILLLIMYRRAKKYFGKNNE